MFIDSKTAEYLTLVVLKGDDLPIIHRCSECDTTFSWSSQAATDHGVVKTSTDWSIVIGCEGYHQLVITPSYTSHGPHTLASHEAEMPNCDDPDCEFHHPEVIA